MVGDLLFVFLMLALGNSKGSTLSPQIIIETTKQPSTTTTTTTTEINNGCGPNATYVYCGSGCRPTCQNPPKPNVGEPQICPAVCIPCSCKLGYLYDENSQNCVLEKDCPNHEPSCPSDEEFLQCGTACPDTCDNWYKPVGACTYNCVSGCFCKKGLVRDSVTGKCVQKDKCTIKPICGRNEEFQNSGTECNCNKCFNKISPSCICKQGYVRNNDNDCVPRIQCFFTKLCQLIDRNSQYSDCAACTRGCVQCYALMCSPGCVCNFGYLSTEDGHCVPADQCPKTTTPRILKTTTTSEIWDQRNHDGHLRHKHKEAKHTNPNKHEESNKNHHH